MKRGWLVGGVIGVLILAWTGLVRPTPGEARGETGDLRSANDLVVFQGQGPAGAQLLLVVDTRNLVMGSYQVDPASGQIALRSVRKFAYDLQLENYNGAGKPTPEEIRDMINRR